MNFILFYLLVKPISMLPFRVLYAISDGLYWLLYRLFGYRRKVVSTNIRKSFPEKTAEECLAIERAFYRHFFDLIVESVKHFSISEKTLLERFKVLNPELVDAYAKKGKSIFVLAGHYGNWEYAAIGLDPQILHKASGIYHPLKSKFWNKKVADSRGKYGTMLVSKKELEGYFEKTQQQPIATIFGTDQSPSNPYRAYWMTFLNQDTPVFFGAEKYAKDFDQPLFFGKISKVKRGYYEMYFELITDTPNEEPYGAITEKHVRILEEQIREAPQYWLWTHKRWKREKPADYEEHLAKYKAQA